MFEHMYEDFDLSSIGVSSSEDNDGGFLGGLDVGGLVESSLLGGLSSLLGGFDISENINLVLDYGLNSWNATTSPEAIDVQIGEILAKVQQVSRGFNNNPSNTLTAISRIVEPFLQHFIHLRGHHANATSTKKAYDKIIGFLKQLKATSLDETISLLRSKGVTVTSVSAQTQTVDESITPPSENWGDRHNLTYNYRKFTVVIPKELQEADGGVQGVEIGGDDHGHNNEQQASSPLLKIGLGILAYKLVRKFI